MVLPAPESPVSQTVNPGSGCGRVTVGEYSRGSAILFRMKRAVVRRADPYRDTEVIDERAPRVNQAVVGTVALVAVLTGWWLLLALLALQLALGLTLGRRWCLACVFYFEVLQPRLGEGPLEDSRPPINDMRSDILELRQTLATRASRRRAGRRRPGRLD